MRNTCPNLLLATYFLCVSCAAAVLIDLGHSIAQTRTVSRSKVLVLSVRDQVNRRFVCDASVVPQRLGILVSQSKSSTKYSKAPKGSAAKKARKECMRKISLRACGDSIDNDEDGTTDFPSDTSCESSIGATEDSPDPIPTAGPTSIPTPTGPRGPSLFRVPFAGSFETTSFFDHDVAREFIDDNGFSRISTGETLINNLDGHEGYDFNLPVGTSIIAAGDGVVEFAGTETPFSCPLLNKTVAGESVGIRHESEDGTYFTIYAHLSRIDVQPGQSVSAGTVLGLSGNTGCSTAPHLHFDVRRQIADGRTASVDPFGWSGTDTDPWSVHPLGSSSSFLWIGNRIPEVYRQLDFAPNPNSGDAASVAFTSIRSMGFNDTTNPNNEFVKLELDPRFASTAVNLTGFYVLNNQGDRYDFPAGTTIQQGLPITIHTGSGTNTSTSLYWNRSAGVWDNDGDCARLFRPTGFRLYYLFYGKKGCTGVSTRQLRTGSAFRTRGLVSPFSGK